MTYMTVHAVQSYFRSNNLVGNFWNDIVYIDGGSYISTNTIKGVVGETKFREMECEVATHTIPAGFDLYSSLRGIGLSHQQCFEVCDLVEAEYTKK